MLLYPLLFQITELKKARISLEQQEELLEFPGVPFDLVRSFSISGTFTFADPGQHIWLPDAAS